MTKAKTRQHLPGSQECKSEMAVDTHDFLSRVGDKWSILLVVVLSKHPKRRARFSDLKNGIEGISQTMLTSTLRSLERDGIITREVYPEVPPRVEYELTQFGLSVLDPMQLLIDWVSKNWVKAKRSREAYDQKKKVLRSKSN